MALSLSLLARGASQEKTLTVEEYEEVISTLAAIIERAGTEESVCVQQGNSKH